MTQEEKAKRYDKALERAREELGSGSYNKGTIEYIFPELAESEDERIRKGLIQGFNECLDSSSYPKNAIKYWHGIVIEDILAWLEKQKELVSTDFDDVWEWADGDELTAPLEKYSKDAIKEMCHAWYDKGIELERKSWLEKQNHVNHDTHDTIETIKRKIIELFDTLVLDQCFSIGGLKYDILKILNDAKNK